PASSLRVYVLTLLRHWVTEWNRFCITCSLGGDQLLVGNDEGIGKAAPHHDPLGLLGFKRPQSTSFLIALQRHGSRPCPPQSSRQRVANGPFCCRRLIAYPRGHLGARPHRRRRKWP